MPWVALDFGQRELKVAAAAAVCGLALHTSWRVPLCCIWRRLPRISGDSEQGVQRGGYPHAGADRPKDW